MGTRETEQSPLWIADVGPADVAGASVLRAAERGAGRARLRSVRRRPVSAILRAGHGPAESGAGPLFPAAAGRLLRRHRCGTRHRVAGGRLVGDPQFPAAGAGRGGAGSLDDFADAALDRSWRRIAPSSRGCSSGWSRPGLLKGKTDRDRRDHAGSQRGDAEHRAARHRRRAIRSF